MSPKELKQIVMDEVKQREEEGYDVAGVKETLLKIKIRTILELNAFLKELERCPLKPSFPYKEPSNLYEIIAERPRKLEKMDTMLSDKELVDRIYGGWLGRCAGCLLGKPVEGFTKEQIEIWLSVAGEYPLRDFFHRYTIFRKMLPDG